MELKKSRIKYKGRRYEKPISAATYLGSKTAIAFPAREDEVSGKIIGKKDTNLWGKRPINCLLHFSQKWLSEAKLRVKIFEFLFFYIYFFIFSYSIEFKNYLKSILVDELCRFPKTSENLSQSR